MVHIVGSENLQHNCIVCLATLVERWGFGNDARKTPRHPLAKPVNRNFLGQRKLSQRFFLPIPPVLPRSKNCNPATSLLRPQAPNIKFFQFLQLRLPKRCCVPCAALCTESDLPPARPGTLRYGRTLCCGTAMNSVIIATIYGRTSVFRFSCTRCTLSATSNPSAIGMVRARGSYTAGRY